MNNDDILDSDEIFELDEGFRVDLISSQKFILLSILSFSLYPLWWSYKIWKFFKEQENLDIVPAARAIFAVFFTWQLFDKILGKAKGEGYTENYSPGLLFGVFFLLNLLSRLPDPFWMISVVTFVAFLPPVKAFNFWIDHSTMYNGKYADKFSGRQIVLMIGGILFWLLVILGTVATLMGI